MPMPISKRLVTRWAVACSLVAALGLSAMPDRAESAPVKPAEATPQHPMHAVPVKRTVARQIHRAAAARSLSCRDRRRLRMGVASWYAGSSFHRTASGEVFRADELAAASRSLPFNTHVRIINLHNGRSVIVRINDRGPFVRGRLIDVTPKAAAQLGMKRHGTAPVYIEIVRNDIQSAAANPVGIDRR
ncbi:MAG: septal ring lytic transglycosylase RlpA family protein [Alphaproteobacteria bacterium]|nr:septal ring lytic transglycosylase RlpA family protein [Alphaproteobacteria bacterium]